MTRTPRKWLGRTIKMLVGAAMLLLVYDIYMPIYNGMDITGKNRVTGGVEATIKFEKKRSCAPVTGTVVAFAHFFEGYRLPAKVIDGYGEQVDLKNFPPSDEPVYIDYKWTVSDELPEVSHVTFGFYIRCITRIPQYVEWTSQSIYDEHY